MKVKISQKTQRRNGWTNFKNGLKRIALEVFENLLAKQLFKDHLLCL